ncbi:MULTISPECIES: peptidylprolyl isomerase [unclassified Corynebacterium]|uniref:peptidylprolyl isomerase n=1 Tax=unclassified Corynebacterium TaxID=2624378 RepID=UPI0029C9D9F1|nr:MULTISPECIES: peptidylprolyl isomerase [unclassified Corynebacterium]WPF65194.1 peptidylprolyl isomerase [Corynebacterium sp. 22KM0430]WPF67689.1 peptidylprolyl isomerase [Corynebacterium sp. 21KM1197]
MNNQQRGQEALQQLDRALRGRDRAEKTKPLMVVLMAAVAILVLVGGIVYAATRDGGDTSAEGSTDTSVDELPTPEILAMSRETPLENTVTCEYPDSGEAAKQVSKPQTKDVPTTGTATVTLNTSQGEIGLELDRSVSPCTVNAITHLAKEKYYDDTVCHRMTNDGIYVLQCGDPSGSGAGGPGFSFADEYPTDSPEGEETRVTYPRGSLAMANSGPDTNGSQFFLNYQDSPLPPAYTYFGQINDKGLETLDKIAENGITPGASPNDGAPAEEVKITSATVS